jgi:hypothetical protein
LKSQEEKARLQRLYSEIFKEWADERTKRLHSSHFGRIYKLTDRTDKDKFVLLLTTVCKLTLPIKHGLKYERIAIEKYQTTKQLQVSKCGIYVCPGVPYLASTPDGICTESHVIEVKCPSVARNKHINEKIMTISFRFKASYYALDFSIVTFLFTHLNIKSI